VISPQDYGVTLASRLDARKEIRGSIMRREMHAGLALCGGVETVERWISGISGLWRCACRVGDGPIARAGQSSLG
jgi:hypothetical protein